MINYVQPGNTLDLTAPAALESGEGVLIGSLFAVAVADIANGAVGAMVVEGVVELPKNTSTATTEGMKMDWDSSAKELVATTTGDGHAGVAVEVKASAATTVKLLLNAAS